MKKELESFITRIESVKNIERCEYIDYFAFFLIEKLKQPFFTPGQIRHCFELISVQPYSNISKYLLSKRKRKGKDVNVFVRIKNGYILERTRKDEIAHEVMNDSAQPLKKSANNLRELLKKISDISQKGFLDEAIKCLDNDAPRASIIMTWIVGMDHMYNYVMKNKLKEFNTVLKSNTENNIKLSVVESKDDFGKIGESQFIELCKKANIITGDVKKILLEKLGTRNSCAHPANIVVKEYKAASFVEDVIENVITKFIV